MPQLQILDHNPGFSSQLGQALGSGAVEGISNQLQHSLAIKQQRKQGTALAEYLGKPEMAEQLGSLPQEFQLEIAKGHFRQKQESQIQKQQSLEQAANSLDRMEALIPESGIGMSGAINPSGKAAFNRGEFSSLQASLIPLFKQMFPRMTNYDLKIIQDNYIPKASDREETIRGKINGLRQMLQTGEMPKEISKGSEKKESPLAKVEAGTKLTPEIAEQILKRAGGDKEKARKAAKHLGYEW
jgi:hypothetical protein